MRSTIQLRAKDRTAAFDALYTEREGKLRDKLIKLDTKVLNHGRDFTFQMAEVGVRSTFREILLLIARARAHPHKHDRDRGRQMRPTMTAEVRLESEINKSRHREAANRSFRPSRQGPSGSHLLPRQPTTADHRAYNSGM